MSRIILMNRTGNCGKTTLAKHWLKPRMGAGTYCVAIENRNAALESYADETVSAELFGTKVAPRLIQAGIKGTSMLVDLGSSNEAGAAEAMDAMSQIYDRVDAYVIPCMPDIKQIDDSIRTASDLLERGVDPAKIVVVKNKVRNRSAQDLMAFDKIERHAAEHGYTVLKTPIVAQALYQQLANFSEHVGEIAHLPLREPDSGASNDQVISYSTKLVMQMEAQGLEQNLNAAYAELSAILDGIEA